MKLEQLRQITTIEKCKSISKAAKELYMGQPALSSSLNNLEKKIGVQIFLRTPQGVFPTEDGKKILETAHNIINASEYILHYSLQNNVEHLTGTIKISLAPAYSYLFFDIATRYKERFPNVELQLSIHSIMRMKELLRHEDYSAAIDFVPEKFIKEEKLSSIRLKPHTIKLFAGPKSKFYHRESVRMEELRDERFLAFSKEYWTENNKNLKVRKTPYFIEDNASIREFLRRSDIIGTMPDVYDRLDAEEYEGRPRMIDIEDFKESPFYGYIVYPGNRQQTILEQQTIRFLKEIMDELE